MGIRSRKRKVLDSENKKLVIDDGYESGYGFVN
jgi:hypothetical protein